MGFADGSYWYQRMLSGFLLPSEIATISTTGIIIRDGHVHIECVIGDEHTHAVVAEGAGKAEFEAAVRLSVAPILQRPLTPEAAVLLMREAFEVLRDEEVSHKVADQLMQRVLRQNGFADVADTFDQYLKWWA